MTVTAVSCRPWQRKFSAHKENWNQNCVGQNCFLIIAYAHKNTDILEVFLELFAKVFGRCSWTFVFVGPENSKVNKETVNEYLQPRKEQFRRVYNDIGMEIYTYPCTDIRHVISMLLGCKVSSKYVVHNGCSASHCFNASDKTSEFERIVLPSLKDPSKFNKYKCCIKEGQNKLNVVDVTMSHSDLKQTLNESIWKSPVAEHTGNITPPTCSELNINVRNPTGGSEENSRNRNLDRFQGHNNNTNNNSNEGNSKSLHNATSNIEAIKINFHSGKSSHEPNNKEIHKDSSSTDSENRNVLDGNSVDTSNMDVQSINSTSDADRRDETMILPSFDNQFLSNRCSVSSSNVLDRVDLWIIAPCKAQNRVLTNQTSSALNSSTIYTTKSDGKGVKAFIEDCPQREAVTDLIEKVPDRDFNVNVADQKKVILMQLLLLFNALLRGDNKIGGTVSEYDDDESESLRGERSERESLSGDMPADGHSRRVVMYEEKEILCREMAEEKQSLNSPPPGEKENLHGEIPEESETLSGVTIGEKESLSEEAPGGKKSLIVKVHKEKPTPMDDDSGVLGKDLGRLKLKRQQEAEYRAGPVLNLFRINMPWFLPATHLTSFSLYMFRAMPQRREHPEEINGLSWEEFERPTMREATFYNYPAWAKIPKDVLVLNGFVYIGKGQTDKVICYFCYTTKENWREEDHVQEFHKRLSPHCPMVVYSDSNNVSVEHPSSSMTAKGYMQGATAAPMLSGGSARPFVNGVGNHHQGGHNTQGDACHSGALNGSVSSLTDEVDSRSRSPLPFHQERNVAASSTSSNSSSGNSDRRMLTASRTSNASGNRRPTRDLAHPEGGMQNHQATSMQNGRPASSMQNQRPATTSAPASADGQTGRMATSTTTSINAGRSGTSTAGSQPNAASTDSNAESPRRHTEINSRVYSIPVTAPQPPAPSNPPQSSDTNGTQQVVTSLAELNIFHERPRRPDYAVFETRLASFDGWPEGHCVNKVDVARSGLFFAGYADCGRCFFCGGGLRNWEPGDDPFVEHARWYPKCAYIRQYMGQVFVDAVQELKNRGGNISMDQVKEHMKNNGASVHIEFDEMDIEDDAAVQSLIGEGYDRDEVIAAARSVKNDDSEVLSADVILEKILEKRSGSNVAVAMPSAIDENIQTLKDENYTLRNNLLCKICLVKEVRMVFLPCGHLACCQECAVAMIDCPVCRGPIRARVRAFIR